MIPRIFWQTFISEDLLPPQSWQGIETWRRQMPGWEWRFRNDEEIRQFFVDHLPEFLKIFDDLPLGVMRADLWRYGVLYIHGGLYTDIDTACGEAPDLWLTADDQALHVACENGTPYFCQWTVASPPGHPVLWGALELAAARIAEDGGVNCNRRDYVHYYTGPDLWTEAIKRSLGTALPTSAIYSQQSLWKGRGLRIYPEGCFTWDKVHHANASYRWDGTGYPSWRNLLEATETRR